MNYVIAWKKVSFKAKGGMVWQYFVGDGQRDTITKTKQLGRAWTTRDPKLAKKICRRLTTSKGNHFANILEFTDKELFIKRLEGK